MHLIITPLVLFLSFLLDVAATPRIYTTSTTHSILDQPDHSIRSIDKPPELHLRAAIQALPPPYYPIVRHVPGTRTIITAHIQWVPIDPIVIGGTIRQAQHRVDGYMKTHGDGALPPIADPWTADMGLGCYVYAKSSDKPGPGGAKQHFTWGILNSTLEGMYTIAYLQGYSQEIYFEVLDSGWGTVGSGYIKAGQLPDMGSGRGNGTVGVIVRDE